VAVLQFVLQVASLTKGIEFIVSGLTFDDTFYYLQTAWNFKQLGVPTFDGINPTNGVQFIWFWIIVVLAFVSPTKSILLIAVYVLSFFLNAICYPIIWKFAEAVQRPKLAPYMASLWFFLAFSEALQD
jgi:hypothetical protein